MEKSACGIVSYAGLTWETLLSRAKALFAQSKLPVPRRFDAFLPIFPLELIQNMDYTGLPDARNARVGPGGFSIDPAEYHRKLYAQLPSLYAEDNYLRNFDYEGRYTGQGAFTVDRAWADRFPQYAPFLGEKLAIHLIGGGFQAVAVPESVYPRGGGVLAAAEAALEITKHVELFNQYARARVATGDLYDADRFQTEYLHTTGLTVTTVTQAQIERALQDLSIIKSLHNEDAGVGLYTENARRAERVFQYVPMRYACDLFAEEAIDKHTARLAQPCDPASDFVSDLWIPYQDVSAYVDRQTMALDMRRLCEAYQIAPRYDPETGGGRYPSAIRVATVRDRALRLLVGEVLNNPAYGDGMGPQGTIGRQAYIADSREMIRQRKLTLEETDLATQNTALPPEEYRKRLALAILQEHKGRLVDAMYRRETALSQIDAQSPVYHKACELLNERVERLKQIVQREGAQSGMSQISGYDADLDYLRRKQQDREGVPEETAGAKPIAFARDPLREQSIESGYAMRSSLLRLLYRHAALPDPPPERTLGADDSEDELMREPVATQTEPTLPIAPTPPTAPAPGRPTASATAAGTDAAVSAHGPDAGRRDGQSLSAQSDPDGTKPGTGSGMGRDVLPTDGLEPSKPDRGLDAASSDFTDSKPASGKPGNADQSGNREAEGTARSDSTGRNDGDDSEATGADRNDSEVAGATQSSDDSANPNSDDSANPNSSDTPSVRENSHAAPPFPGTQPDAPAEDSVNPTADGGRLMPSENSGADGSVSAAGQAATVTRAPEPDAGSEPAQANQPSEDIQPSEASMGYPQSSTNPEETAESAVEPAAEPAALPASDSAEAGNATAASDVPSGGGTAHTGTPHRRRVSLRELTERQQAETPPEASPAEAPPPEPAAEENEPPKPKLAYILHRGTEEAANKSFSRMSELLRKRDE